MRLFLKATIATWMLASSITVQAEPVKAPRYADSIEKTNEPMILEDSIIFNDGSVVSISRKNRNLFKDPEASLNAGGLPVSYFHEVITVPDWQQIFLLTQYNYYEGGGTHISRYDFKGNFISRKRFEGEVKVLENSKRLILAGISSHWEVEETLIFDDKDRLVATLKYNEFLPSIFDFDVSKDEKLIWFFSRGIRLVERKTLGPGVPLTHITVVDHDGNLVKKIKSFKEETVPVIFKGKEYRIQTGIPDFPG